jgi:hypothetical protein
VRLHTETDGSGLPFKPSLSLYCFLTHPCAECIESTFATASKTPPEPAQHPETGSPVIVHRALTHGLFRTIEAQPCGALNLSDQGLVIRRSSVPHSRHWWWGRSKCFKIQHRFRPAGNEEQGISHHFTG